VQTTIHETVRQPDTTATATDVSLTTITSLCPVTRVTTIGGKERTITFTTTKLIETNIPTTVQKTVERPDVTATATEEELQTVTNIQPVTEVITVGGERKTIVHTTTKVIEVSKPKTVFQTVTEPGTTEKSLEVVFVTETREFPVTKTIVIPGGKVTEIIQTTRTEVVSTPATFTVTQSAPPVTTTATQVPTAGAQTNNVPAAAVFAGVAGFMALL